MRLQTLTGDNGKPTLMDLLLQTRALRVKLILVRQHADQLAAAAVKDPGHSG